MEPQDTITIAPSVLITIAAHAATSVRGVARMGTVPVNIGRLLRGSPMASGVVLQVSGQHVTVDVYLVMQPDVSMRDVSREAQQSITRSIQELVGMEVDAVNVHIDDVEYGPGAAALPGKSI
jgi:uncharacterized alkaline shock family protein YloU